MQGNIFDFKLCTYLQKHSIEHLCEKMNLREGEHKAPVSQTQDQGLLDEMSLITLQRF